MQLRLCSFLCCAAVALSAAPPVPRAAPSVPLSVRPALDAITAANLKGNLSFLASDALEGRYSPSPGLNIAAEFIASQFRAAGLEPGVNGDYFQIAELIERRIKPAETDLTLVSAGSESTVKKAALRIVNASSVAHIDRCPALVFKEKNPDALKGVDLTGKAVVAPNLNGSSLPESERIAAYERSQAFDEAVAQGKARIEILVGAGRSRGNRPRLLDRASAQGGAPPVVVADTNAFQSWLSQPSTTASDRFVSIDVPAPDDKPLTLKNVVGILPGSDPKLKNTYVLLTAHYDHIGTIETGAAMSDEKPGQSKDKIYNGANDDGSGTVSVIEIARGLSRLKIRPKRTLVFMTFFGEERGDVGSHYYGAHPVFPLAQTVADLNLEQVGRTDSTDGKQLSNATVTGFDYSSVTRYLQNAGSLTGVTVYLNKEASDAYFERSDNAALAQVGIPAHTLCVAFDYPDYHGLGDEWPKVDYINMAKVDRMVALALYNMANAIRPPSWNIANPKTVTFRTAQARTLEAAR